MNLVKIYTAQELTRAHFVRALLDREGIEATVLGDHLSLAVGGLPVTRGTLPAVWVPADAEAQAREIVQQYEGGATPARAVTDARPWTCPRCGEAIEPQFTDCWNCQASRPEPATDAPADDPATPRAVGPIPADVACSRCGYNLHGLHPAGRCPECGAAILPSLLAILRQDAPDRWDVAELLVRDTIEPVAARLGQATQAVLFLLESWPRGVAAVTPPSESVATGSDGAGGSPASHHDRAAAAPPPPPPPEHVRRTRATRLCRFIARSAAEQFGGSADALRVLRGWNLATCESLAALAFALIGEGFLDPVPHLRQEDFPHGSIELLLPE
ncbi:MAG TPA: DUF2007 domain-containing protein [Tepidisphaeraceae bacterium]|nr:DUF2007 domain-containing protein [Tepidisphaeraceae bacterium]